MKSSTEMISERFSPYLSPHACVEWAVHSDDISSLKKGSQKRLSNVVVAFREQYGDHHDFLLVTLRSQGSERVKVGSSRPNRPSRAERSSFIGGELLKTLAAHSLFVVDVHQGKDGSKSQGYEPRFLGISGPVEVALEQLALLSMEEAFRVDVFLSVQASDDLAGGTNPQEVAEAIQKEFDAEQTDAQGLATRRLEQGYLRQRLLGGRKGAQCICCGRELPVNLLVAAHIKRRSACTLEERLDFENIAALMCVLGCDALFERGLIYATHEGWHLAETLPASVKEQVFLTEGVGFITDDNKKYFEWHRKQVADNR